MIIPLSTSLLNSPLVPIPAPACVCPHFLAWPSSRFGSTDCSAAAKPPPSLIRIELTAQDAGSHYKPCLQCVNRTDVYDAFTQECSTLGKYIGDSSIKQSSATQASGSIFAVGAVAVGGALVALF